MHFEALQFVEDTKEQFPNCFRNCRVLEVGSRNVNGSPRELFRRCDYTGIDLIYGVGVDIVMPMTEYAVTGCGLFDTVVCTEVLEHDKDYKATLQAMYDVLKPDGLLIVTAAGVHRPPHGTEDAEPEDSPATLDYYRNIREEDLREFAERNQMICKIQHGRGRMDIYFYGIKGGYNA